MWWIILIAILLVIIVFNKRCYEGFNPDIYLQKQYSEIISLDYDTYNDNNMLEYMNEQPFGVRPQEILASPISWYTYPWFSTKYGLTLGAGAYSLKEDNGNNIGRIGHNPLSCVSQSYV